MPPAQSPHSSPWAGASNPSGEPAAAVNSPGPLLTEIAGGGSREQLAAAPLRLLVATRSSPFAGDSGSGAYVADVLAHLAREDFRLRIAWTAPPDLVPTRGWYRPRHRQVAGVSLRIMNTLKLGPWFWQPDVVWLPFRARCSHRIKRILESLGLWRKPRPVSAAGAPRAHPPDTAPCSGAWDAEPSPREIAFVQEQIREFRPDVVLANYAWMTPTVRPETTSGPPCAVLTLDVRHRQLVLEDGRTVERFGELCSRDREARLLRAADGLIAIQGTEARIFARMFPETPVVIARMAATPRPLPAPSGRDVLFVGSGHEANVRGLSWFVSHVWPAVLGQVPEARLLVAGSICGVSHLPEGPNLQQLGHLDSLEAAYSLARVVIAPILRGSGLKIKILEAVSFGCPCVTTSVGAEGYEDLRPALRVADEAAGFAAATTELLTEDAAQARVRAAFARAAAGTLSPAPAYADMVGLLRSLAAGRKPTPNPS